MTDNSKLEQLYQLLDEAEKLAGQFRGGYSNNFFSAEEFHAALAQSIVKFKAGDNDQLNDLWLWFAPTCDWDDFIHQEGADLANEIHPLVTELRKSLMYNIKHYAFHGIGLAVEFDDKTTVDFDLAFFPEPRHDGFDLWRLCEFVSTRPIKYSKYLDKKKLEADFNEQIERGVIVKPVFDPLTNLYFFKSSLARPRAVEPKKTKP